MSRGCSSDTTGWSSSSTAPTTGSTPGDGRPPALALFLRHRDHYPTWRTSLALLTLACVVIQLVPTAPPRLFPELGILDTGRLYGDSVYGALQDPGPAGSRRSPRSMWPGRS